MSKNESKKSLTQLIIFNNRYLMIFCIVIAIILWAAVKINYSDDAVRTVSDVKVNLSSSTVETDFTAFYDEAAVLVDVEISGKAYNINSYAISKDDIIVETAGNFIDSAGYKTLYLSAKISDASAAAGVEITGISPSTVTVYYDRKVTESFNVTARLSEIKENLVKDGYIVGQPVASMKTVEVTGPATILAGMDMVYFDTVIDKEKLPLVSSAEFPAELVYGIDRESEMKYLSCLGVDNETNPPKVTLPVYVKKNIPVNVKFLNQPLSYNGKAPDYIVSPSEIEVICNPKDEGKYNELTVGSIDFSKLDNKMNTIELPFDDENLAVKIADNAIEKFTVEVDMSKMQKATFAYSEANVLFLNQQEGLSYTLGTGGNISSITIIGSKKSIEKLTADNIQIEINVSALNVSGSSSQLLPVSNISINSEDINDCWVYGSYTAFVTASEESE